MNNYFGSEACVAYWQEVSSKIAKKKSLFRLEVQNDWIKRAEKKRIKYLLDNQLLEFPLVYNFPECFPKKVFAKEIVFVLGEDASLVDRKGNQVSGYYWVAGKEAKVFRVHQINLLEVKS